MFFAPDAPSRRTLRRAKIIAGVLCGIAVMGVAGGFRFGLMYNDVSRRADETIEYVRRQSLVYDSYNDGSVSKSLVRTIDAAGQLARDLYYIGDVSTDGLARYCDELRLTGALVLDESGDVQADYLSDPSQASCIALSKSSTVLDCMDHPKKVYSEHLDLTEGDSVDLAATARLDARGVVVALYKPRDAYEDSYALSVKSLLKGYGTTTGTSIVLEQAGKVVAANAPAMGEGGDGDEADLDRVDHVVLKAIKSTSGRDDVSYIRVRGKGYFCRMSRARDYYVYVYEPANAIVSGVVEAVIISAVVYGAFMALAVSVARRADQRRLEERLADELRHRKRLAEAADKAERANRAKTEFLQRMSHDIRTPINGVLGAVGVAETCPEDLERQTVCRTEVKNASHLLLGLVNEILDMSKLESGEITLEDVPFDIIELRDEVRSVVQLQADERGIEIVRRDGRIDHRHLHGSPVHVKRLLLNVLSNAVKYNRAGGRVELRCREVSYEDGVATLEFVCADTGIGISDEFKERVFEPFAQEGQVPQAENSGTGLGMPIARKLARAMGGDVTFTSELGVGTTFTITVPFAVDGSWDESSSPQEGESELAAQVAGLKVLLVEDNRLNREIAEYMLRRYRMDVTTATDGTEAVSAFEASEPGHFDAVLMDVMMPVMDGYAATRAIRASGRPDADTPVIGMSANAFSDDRLRAKEVGMDDYVAKPIEAGVLLKMLVRYCASTERREESHG